MRTFVNDVEVSANQTDGAAHIGDFFAQQDSSPKVSPSKLEKVQKALWNTGAKVDKALTVAEKSFKKRVVKKESLMAKKLEVIESQDDVDEFYFHNPPHETPQYDNAPPGLLSAMTESVYRTLTGRRPRPNPANQSSRQLSPVSDLDEVKIKDIAKWMRGAALDGQDTERFIACTTAQLKSLDGDTLEMIHVIKYYIGPPSTPVQEFNEIYNDLEEDHELKPWEIDPTILPPFVPFKEFDPDAVHKDLARHLGIRKAGLQILGTQGPSNFDVEDNLSDYYGMPILESPEQYKSNYKVNDDKPEVGDGISVIQTSERRFNVFHFDENVSSDESDGALGNIFYPVHSESPGESLVLYLHGKGMSLDNVSDILGPLDNKWVYKWSSRWWNGFRIPDRTYIHLLFLIMIM